MYRYGTETFCLVFFIVYLSKAFDNFDHSMLISNLECESIRRNGKNRIENYVDRYQFVHRGQYPTKCGVPQGSIMGHLMI